METTEQPNNENVSSMSSEKLIELMNSYNTPGKVVEEQTQKPIEQTQSKTVESSPPVQQPVNTTDPNAPFGYYLRGKKKGQPRSTPYIQVKNGQLVQPVLNQNPTINQQPNNSNEAQLGGMLIDAGLFLVLVNMLVPMLITFANNYFSDQKIRPEQLELKKDQLKVLDPVVDKVLKQVNMTGNPIVILFLGLFTAFGLNFMAAKMDTK